jgi:hypothetical protein
MKKYIVALGLIPSLLFAIVITFFNGYYQAHAESIRLLIKYYAAFAALAVISYFAYKIIHWMLTRHRNTSGN